jgi:transcription termination factor Rho
MPRVPCHCGCLSWEGKNQPAGSLLAECQFISNASTMRKQELMFGILKQLSARETDIVGEGVVEVLPDGFG